MPIRHSLWRVGEAPQRLGEGALPTEALLERMIVATPEILSDQWMLVGRQEETGHGGRIDLLALAPDGTLILIELKRDRTPREVVAQALDYAAWVETLDAAAVARIYARFRPNGELSRDFQARFGSALDESTLNGSHQVVIVASTLDAASERIVGYLSRRGLPINVLCFQVFGTGTEQLLSRAWLLDPTEVQATASAAEPATAREPWNGEFYVSFGHSDERSWPEAVHYGFICAGGGTWYSGTLNLLKVGDRVWVKAPDYGFVGVGRVTGPRQPASDFTLPGEDGQPAPAMSLLRGGGYHRHLINDPASCEYFVPVAWADTISLDRGISEGGLFGNQNTVCRPRTPKWRHTVERLKVLLPNYDCRG